MRQGHSALRRQPTARGITLLLMAADEPGEAARRKPPGGRLSDEGEDLPYKVELWNETKTAVEQVLAVTASASIGHAAFYAAAREHADRYVTLRHKRSVINRWNAPTH